MALGTWKIYDPVSSAYETLDKASEKHQLLMAADEFTRRDEGMSSSPRSSLPTCLNRWLANPDPVRSEQQNALRTARARRRFAFDHRGGTRCRRRRKAPH